jgi:hypothetical protein
MQPLYGRQSWFLELQVSNHIHGLQVIADALAGHTIISSSYGLAGSGRI